MNDRTNNILSALPKLTPEERLRLEDLVVARVLDEEHERLRATNPRAAEVAERDARAFVEAVGPLTPEAAEKVRRACAECALSVLAERNGTGD